MAGFLPGFDDLEAESKNAREVAELTAKRQSRSTDPPTSKWAALRHELSTRAGSNREKCLDAVYTLGEATAGEIAAHAGLEYHEAVKRLADCRNRKDVENGPARPCKVRKTDQQTWRPVA